VQRSCAGNPKLSWGNLRVGSIAALSLNSGAPLRCSSFGERWSTTRIFAEPTHAPGNHRWPNAIEPSGHPGATFPPWSDCMPSRRCDHPSFSVGIVPHTGISRKSYMESGFRLLGPCISSLTIQWQFTKLPVGW